MFMTLIRDRRSIRQFTDKPVEKEKVDLLIEGGLRSPSSRGLNPWEFIVIKKRPTLEKLSRSKPHGAGFLKNAALGIAVIADPEKCDVWIEDSSIASTYIQLAAKSMGLESCWVQIRERFY
ncbi:MAG: NAD(P)H-dependent dehydrogenase/reductase, partial [Desulfobacula sp.]|nr:NAD(P)H-dependent dehydrogenase/reductase [Desulfobacula sp.]